MRYIPQINDYVQWTKGVEGWVYFKDSEYITIEASVRPKDPLNYQAAPFHANNRLLVLCYKDQWQQLTYVKSRESIYEEEENSVEMVGKGTGGKSIQL